MSKAELGPLRERGRGRGLGRGRGSRPRPGQVRGSERRPGRVRGRGRGTGARQGEIDEYEYYDSEDMSMSYDDTAEVRDEW